MNTSEQGDQRGARGHQVASKDHVSRPWACSKNTISMINVSTLTNISTKIIEGKLSKIFISEVCIKLVALRINRYTRSSLQFQKVCDPGLEFAKEREGTHYQKPAHEIQIYKLSKPCSRTTQSSCFLRKVPSLYSFINTNGERLWNLWTKKFQSRFFHGGWRCLLVHPGQ